MVQRKSRTIWPPVNILSSLLYMYMESDVVRCINIGLVQMYVNLNHTWYLKYNFYQYLCKGTWCMYDDVTLEKLPCT